MSHADNPSEVLFDEEVEAHEQPGQRTTASLMMPGEHVQVMLDQAAGPFRASPIMVVDDARAWCTSRRDQVTIWLDPEQIPGGYWAAFEDPFGNPIYVLDQSESTD